MNGYISALSYQCINLPTMSIILPRCLCIMTSVLGLTVWRGHCLVLPFKADRILTLQMDSTYNPLLTNCKILKESIFYTFSIVWKIGFSTRIPTDTSFESSSCPCIIQMYQMYATQRCIRRCHNSCHWLASLCTTRRAPGTPS
jgi:hypothetical protein